MRTCKRCGYTGPDEEIKRCPNFSDKWKGKYICKNCFKTLRNHLNGNHKDEKVQCPYCGSPVKKFTDICPICHHKFKKDFFKKYEDNSLDVDTIYKEENQSKEEQDVKPVLISSGMKFFLVFFVIAFLVMFVGFYGAGFNIFGSEGVGALLPGINSEKDFYGTWELDSFADFSWPDSDTYDMYWTFYKNESIEIIRTFDTNDKLDLEERSKITDWCCYKVKDDKLTVYFFSEDNRDFWDHKGISKLMKFDCSFKRNNKVLNLGYTFGQDIEMLFVKA